MDPGIMILGVAAMATWALGFPMHRHLEVWGVLDKPNERSSHSRPTVRGGGLAMMLVLMPIMAWVGWWRPGMGTWWLLANVLILAGVSFADDFKPVSVKWRFGCHFAVATMFLLGWSGGGSACPYAGFCPLTVGILVVLWLVGSTNAFNFMDGINGLAAGQGVVTGLGMAVVGAMSGLPWGIAPIGISLAAAGVCIGFLPHNFPRARMFMGDVGSAPLGFLMAALTLWIAAYRRDLLIPLVLLHANFVLDTGITFLRRLARRDRVWEPHREHFYQRFIRAGKSHVWVTGMEMALQVVVLLLVMLCVGGAMQNSLVLVLTVIPIWLGFFAWAEITFRRSLEKKIRVG